MNNNTKKAVAQKSASAITCSEANEQSHLTELGAGSPETAVQCASENEQSQDIIVSETSETIINRPN